MDKLLVASPSHHCLRLCLCSEPLCELQGYRCILQPLRTLAGFAHVRERVTGVSSSMFATSCSSSQACFDYRPRSVEKHFSIAYALARPWECGSLLFMVRALMMTAPTLAKSGIFYVFADYLLTAFQSTFEHVN